MAQAVDQKQDDKQPLVIKLKTGNTIPVLGFGTYDIDPKDAYKAVSDALTAGYRHIDTAELYKNEAEVGKAIKDSKIDRKDIFLTTKLWGHETKDGATKQSVDARLKLLDVDYIDLLLIHSPVGGFNVKTFNELCKAKAEGKVKAIGVSNYGLHHLKALEKVTKELPDVLQVELHVWRQQKAVRDYCKEKGIVVEAYSSLAKGIAFKNGDKQKQLDAVAKNYKDKSAAQCMLKWNVQSGNVILVKSLKPERMKQNMDVFDWKLSEEDMKLIETYEENWNCFGWDPSSQPIEGNDW